MPKNIQNGGVKCPKGCVPAKARRSASPAKRKASPAKRRASPAKRSSRTVCRNKKGQFAKCNKKTRMNGGGNCQNNCAQYHQSTISEEYRKCIEAC